MSPSRRPLVSRRASVAASPRPAVASALALGLALGLAFALATSAAPAASAPRPPAASAPPAASTPPAASAAPATRAPWSLSDRVAGSQLSNFARRWSAAWTLLDSMRMAEPRPDLGGIVFSTFRGGRMVLTYAGERPELEQWEQELRVGPQPGSYEVVEASPGRMVLDLPPDTTMFLRTERPASDFSLVPLEHEDDHEELIWYPELVEKVARGAVLRATHMQATNWWYEDSPEAELRLEDRPTDADFLQSGRFGTSIELLVDLANRAGTDFWWCVPARADDAYVRAVARVIHERLGPGRRVFVECGNEVWNAIPPYEAQRRWMRAEADRRGILQDLDDYARGVIMHAIRTVEMGRIAEDVLGEDRAIVVLAQQVGMPWFHDLAAERLGTEGTREVEALAIAPYFGHGVSAMLGEASDEEILAALRESLVGDEEADGMHASGEAARRHGWPLIAYEGGQHMVPPGGWEATDAAREQMQRINESEDMGELYRRWLAEWSTAGGGLFMHYGLVQEQDGRWGAFGLFDRTNEGPTPKSRAFFGWAEFPRER